MKFTRKDFYSEIFQPYNQAVKCGEYEKIEYSLWRTLRDWCCDMQWKDFCVMVKPIPGGYDFFLWHDIRCGPETIHLARTSKHDFAKYLEEHRDGYEMYDISYTSQLINDHFSSNLASGVTYNYFSKDDCKISTLATTATAYSKSSDPDLDALFDKVCKQIEEHNEKEKKEMKFGNFDFGPVDSSVRISLYGMAIKNAAGTYVAYDAKSKQIMDVDILNFDGANKFMYKMPVALSDVKTGDVVIHSRRPMFVIDVNKDNRFKVLDIYDGEEKTIVPAKSPFGFDFLTKVISLFNVGNATGDTPFGNMLPLLLLSDNKNTDDILPLMLMTQGNSAFTSNPMVMYALLSKDDKMNDMLPFMLMCGGSLNPAGCNGACAGNCDK